MLQRGGLLALTVEKWFNQGLWVISRADSNYPQRLKQQLKSLAPPILYGIGNQDLLLKGGLAVVGSRNVDQEGLDYTYRIVETCAEQKIQVISGGAKGVDQASMLGTLKAGGTAIGILANNLLKASVNGQYRPSIKEGKLTLISAVDPNASFHVGNAMGRNKYIYALANYGLVISADHNTGGTWAGATEALNIIKNVPVLVRMQGAIPEGNQELSNRLKINKLFIN
ncbi:DNA-processing protein DprA [Crocosphaera sp. UHCC 0190]|uniref:DNA-processing protein DprA n=1 Tax=Crocosphaera sp. UHCC 0190 TaxID=3110246 RepID=UPI002B21767F|nr:DNA-processing protein DprA [Crocosphaera sp. UHCC 0190]MEA5508910.1 DNA-processing protein DprA [Crocosphaera sp. UHCC 0190]